MIEFYLHFIIIHHRYVNRILVINRLRSLIPGNIQVHVKNYLLTLTKNTSFRIFVELQVEKQRNFITIRRVDPT